MEEDIEIRVRFCRQMPLEMAIPASSNLEEIAASPFLGEGISTRYIDIKIDKEDERKLIYKLMDYTTKKIIMPDGKKGGILNLIAKDIISKDVQNEPDSKIENIETAVAFYGISINLKYAIQLSSHFKILAGLPLLEKDMYFRWIIVQTGPSLPDYIVQDIFGKKTNDFAQKEYKFNDPIFSQS